MDKTQFDRIKKQTVEIILTHPFFASLLLRLKLIEDNEQPTFCTDGEELRYNADFARSLSNDLIRGVLAHEVLHPALGHPWRVGHRNLRLCNIAADHVVNIFLNEYNDGFATPPFPLPEGALCDMRFKGMAMEAIYTVLESEQVDGPDPNPGRGEFTEGKEDGDDKAPGTKLERINDWANATVQAAHAAAMMGKSPACVSRLVESAVRPVVPWYQLLRRFVSETAQEDYDWTKADRRFLPDFYLPDLHSESTGELVFAIDTSGSVSSRMLAQFLAEAEEALSTARPSKLVLMQCDAEVHEVAEFTPGDRVATTLKGGGGTHFAPIFEEVAQRQLSPLCVIVLTDLYGGFPKTAPDYPVLWVTYGGDSAPFGEVVRFNT